MLFSATSLIGNVVEMDNLSFEKKKFDGVVDSHL